MGRSSQAELWLRRAAVAGHPEAMGSLAAVLQRGDQLDEAEIWFRRAIQAGETSRMRSLAELLDKRGNSPIEITATGIATKPASIARRNTNCRRTNIPPRYLVLRRIRADRDHTLVLRSAPFKPNQASCTRGLCTEGFRAAVRTLRS